MSREAAEPLDSELDDLIIEGLEGAEHDADRAASRFTGTDADAGDDQGAGTADEVLDDGADEFEAAEAPPARRAAAPAAATQADEQVDDDNPIITRDDGAKWNHSAGRWQKDGKFVEGEAPRGYTGAATTAATGAPAAGTESAASAAAAVEQGWQPFAVQVDKAQSAIPEAQVSRANGHHFLAIPDDKMPDFQRRIVRGVAAERMWRQLDTGLKDLERERELAKNRPAVRSDSEVEADMMLEAIKDRLPDLFDEQQLENLSLKIKLAQRDEREKAGNWEREQRTQTTEAETTQRTQFEGIAQTIVELVEDPQHATAFAGLTDDDLKAVMQEITPVANAVYYREGTNWIRNQQYLYDRLAARAAWKQLQGRTTAAPAAGTSTTGATDATPPKGGTTATSSATTRAERMNRAHDTAARPASTSVKAGRTAGSRPAATAAHHREPPKTTRPAAQVAEDAFRKTQRSYLNSPSLDFEDPEED